LRQPLPRDPWGNAVGEEVAQQDVQAVEGAGTLGHHILSPLGEQPQDLDAAFQPIFGMDPGEPLVTQGGQSGEGRVQAVVLAGVARREHSHARGGLQ